MEVAGTLAAADGIVKQPKLAFDIVVFDLTLPDGQPPELKKIHTEAPRSRNSRLVIASGHADIGAVARQLGIAHYLLKPADLQAILELAAQSA